MAICSLSLQGLMQVMGDICCKPTLDIPWSGVGSSPRLPGAISRQPGSPLDPRETCPQVQLGLARYSPESLVGDV